MQRIQEHRLKLAKTIDDDRIGGDNRLLAQMLAMWIDCKIPKRGGQPKTADEIAEAGHEAWVMEKLLLARFVGKNGIKNIDRDDPEIPVSKLEKEATTISRAAIDDLLGRG